MSRSNFPEGESLSGPDSIGENRLDPEQEARLRARMRLMSAVAKKVTYRAGLSEDHTHIVLRVLYGNESFVEQQSTISKDKRAAAILKLEGEILEEQSKQSPLRTRLVDGFLGFVRRANIRLQR